MKKIAAILISTALITALLTSCEWTNPDDPEFESNLKSAQVVTTNNSFGLELFSMILEDEEKANVMISPASISLALGMTYNGAETTTKEAFEEVLNYEGLTREEVNEVCRNLIEVLVTDSKGNLLEIANSIWYRDEFPVHQSFFDLNTTYYDAEVRELDFASPAAVDVINGWVSNKTHDKIDEIIKELSPDAMMVLINALYFNCVWEYEFDKKETEMLPFYYGDGTGFQTVEMMKTESSFNYASTEEFTAVELPYKNKKFSMHLFLPSLSIGLDGLIEEFSGEKWMEWMDEYQLNDEVQVVLPKFKFDYDREIGKDLKDMGLEIAFSDAADFSGISDISLLISKVLHKTYIDCNEEGTEAAAVTAVVMELTSAIPSGPTVITFDRPFLFAITENSSNSIVFIGKLAEPEYE
ncbi:serpin family protein [Bacteroidota bacterium]